MGVTLNPFTGNLDITGGGGSSAGVSSIAATAQPQLSGDVTLSAGTSVTLTQVGQNIEIAATGASGAPSDAKYVTLATNATLTEERVLTGTASRISLTDNGAGSTVVVDIDAAYVGQASITTLGTIATGTWSATTIAVNKGGTGQTSYTDGQLLIGNTTGNTLAKATLTGTANQVVVTNGSGAITLSLPQSIDTGATVTFSKLTLSLAGIGLVVSQDATIAGYLRVGSGSAPSNTTAGDLTAVRLNIGNTGAFSASNGEFVSIAGTMTDTSGASAFMSVSPTAAPASNSSAAFQGLNFLLSLNGSGTFTNTNGGTGVNMAVQPLSSGTITGVVGLACIPVQLPSSGSAVTMTITNVTGITAYMVNIVAGSATTSLTITTAIAYDIPFGIIGNSAQTITTAIGYRMQDILSTGNTITTLTGIRIAKLTKGTTNNYGAEINQPGIANSTGATTDSIAIKVATASVAMGNTTNTTTNAFGVYLGIQTYTSTTNVRTITNGVTHYIEGAPSASTNVIIGTKGPSALYIDAATTSFHGGASGGTTTQSQNVYFGIPTYTAVTATRTITDAANVYIAGAPVASTNTAITNAWSLWIDAGNTRWDGLMSVYNGVTTAGYGLATIVAAGRATGQTAANTSVSTYTVGAADGSFDVSANVLVTTTSAENFTVTCTYTDEGNTSRVLTLNFQTIAAAIGTAINFANGAVPYEGIVVHIRAKASTSITIKTTGTFTGATYNVEGIIKQTA